MTRPLGTIFPGRGSDDIDMAESCPDQRQTEQRDDGRANRATNRRRRGLDDLQRRRQKGELVVFAAFPFAGNGDDILRGRDAQL